ncbi:hypothetical protein AB0H83_11225 [Dactylosporangium sp. NPDC050688]|uniref:hypothetical protein n=1 Tax=Dactylosporangium sp. NPDC050688 TaxID=3157217 RepID=UPI003402E71B
MDRLIADGITVRDAGRVFDLSPQRVAQITGKGRKALVRRRRAMLHSNDRLEDPAVTSPDQPRM